DALTAALQNNFQTRQAALAVAIARAQLREAEAQKAVTLGGSASFTDNSLCCGGAPVSGTISIPGAPGGAITNLPFTATGFGGTAATNSVFALTFKYPLYTGGALEAQIAIARANELIAEAQFAAAAEQVVFSGLPEVPQDVDVLIQQALQRRPEVAAARASEVGAQAAIDLAASGLAPNVTIQAGPQIQTSDPTSRDSVNFTGTITLTLAILDGGLTHAKVEEARSRLQSARVTEEQTRQQVELDVRNAYLSLGNAADVLRSALAGQT